MLCCFFFQAEDGIRDKLVTGVQTCALPIYPRPGTQGAPPRRSPSRWRPQEIGRASCRGRGEISGGAGSLKKKKEKQKENNNTTNPDHNRPEEHNEHKKFA